MPIKRYDRYQMEGGPAFSSSADAAGMTLFEFFVGQSLASFTPRAGRDAFPSEAASWAIQCAGTTMRRLEELRMDDGVPAWKRRITPRRSSRAVAVEEETP